MSRNFCAIRREKCWEDGLQSRRSCLRGIALKKGEIMRIYNCPHCGERSFNPWTKAFAGQLNSKGKPCKKCGRLCVNGKGATIFNALYCLIAFAAIVFIYLKSPDIPWLSYWELILVPAIIISILIVPKLVNAFFFKMAPAIRIDYR